MTDDSEKSAFERFKQGKREMEEELQNDNRSGVGLPDKVIRKLAQKAESSTVTGKRLKGEEQYFYNVLPFLEEDEQPHFLFPLTRGIFADPALTVESGAEREDLLDKSDGGSVVITDRYVRVHSSKGEWTIPYNSIVSVDFVGHPALHIQTAGRTYYINIAGTFFDEEQNLSEAASFIRQKQQNAESGDASENNSTDPLERLEKLNDLKESGALTEEEFNEKKQDLLDQM